MQLTSSFLAGSIQVKATSSQAHAHVGQHAHLFHLMPAHEVPCQLCSPPGSWCHASCAPRPGPEMHGLVCCTCCADPYH